MGASIDQPVNTGFAIPGNDNRARTNLTYDKTVGLGNFALVGQIDPRRAENAALLKLEHIPINIQRAMHSTGLYAVIPVQGVTVNRAAIRSFGLFNVVETPRVPVRVLLPRRAVTDTRNITQADMTTTDVDH